MKVVNEDVDGLSALWTGARIVRIHHSYWLVGCMAPLWNKTRGSLRVSKFTSAQKLGARIMVQWGQHYAVASEVRPDTYGRMTLDLSEPHFPHLCSGDEIVYVKALSVNSKVLSLWKPLLLFAKSEYSLLFMIHKPGWLLESLMGVGGLGGALGKHRFAVSPQTCWIRNSVRVPRSLYF